jgi:hypothetical protein
MIIGIEGFLGDGKTIYMVRCAKIDHKNGRKIYANFHLKNIPYIPLNINDFLLTENADKFKNCTILIDEITLFMDCRRSSRKENIAISTLLRQSRKRSIDIYYTCQNLDETDLRLSRYTSIFVIAQRCYGYDMNGSLKEIDNYRQYIIIDTRQRTENIKRMNMDISQYYDYYDTDEIIESIYENKKNEKK